MTDAKRQRLLKNFSKHAALLSKFGAAGHVCKRNMKKRLEKKAFVY